MMVSMECVVVNNIPVGDHNILVGQIVDCRVDDKNAPPLLYFDRAYREPGPALG